MLKYDYEMQQVQDCPNQNCEPRTVLAYRFVHDDVPALRSFLPVAKINPKRKFKNTEKHCSGFGLSMYASIDSAKEAYNTLIAINPNIPKNIGTKLASGTILPHFGLCTPENEHCHFDLYEENGINLSAHFTYVEDLI